MQTKKQSKTFEDKISKYSNKTKSNIYASWNSFDRFCGEFYDGRKADEIITELKTFKGSDRLDPLREVLQNWIDWMYKNGNPACRDIQTNQIVDQNTGLRFDSQTGDVTLNDEQMMYVGIGVAVIIIIIIVGVGISSRKESNVTESSESFPRRGRTNSQHKEILRRQNGVCAMCGEYSGSYHFDHIDDNHYNNDLSNAQALCPNCHDRKTRKLD